MTKKGLRRIRLFMTFGLLMAYTAFIVALTAISMNSGYSIPAIIMWLIATPILTLFLSVVWRYKLVLLDEEQKPASGSLEKRKRDRIDSVLRDLSSEDLQRLKQRLIDGTVNEDLLYEEFVGDDGEILYSGSQ